MNIRFNFHSKRAVGNDSQHRSRWAPMIDKIFRYTLGGTPKELNDHMDMPRSSVANLHDLPKSW